MQRFPCGYYGSSQRECSCTPTQISRYESKLSGPLLDRIDIHLEVNALPFEEMSSKRKGESSKTIKKRVVGARRNQIERFKDHPSIFSNGQMGTKELETFCLLDTTSTKLLQQSVKRLGLSARGYTRILKIARTIADLDQSNQIQSNHIAEAVQYRRVEASKNV